MTIAILEHTQKYENAIEDACNAVDKKNEIYRELKLLQLAYIKYKYGAIKGDIFSMPGELLAIEWINVYQSLEPDEVFLNCSRLLKSGKWSKKTEIYTLSDFIFSKDTSIESRVTIFEKSKNDH